MTLPVYETDASANESDGTILVTAPTGIVDDNLLIQSGSNDFSGAGDTTYTPTSGMTDCGSGYINADNTAASVSGQLFYDIAASESGDYTMTESNGSLGISIVSRISGVDTTTPIHKFASNSGTSSEPTTASVTTTIDDCLILTMVTWDQSKTYVDGFAGAGWTVQQHHDVSGHDQMFATKGLATAGASGAVSVNLSSGTRWVTFTVAIAPPAAGGNAPIGTLSGPLGGPLTGVF